MTFQNGDGGQKNEANYDYVFGFGSIINTSTHAPWLDTDFNDENSTRSTCLTGQRAIVTGYKRGWNFRSNTGFTALGIVQDDSAKVNGVLFQIRHQMLSGFDRREVGYHRLQVSREQLELQPPANETSKERLPNEAVLDIKPHECIWIYVPKETTEANEDHPILQSYVDTVLQGCLEWGGEDMAREFVATTHNWSPYFLNDTPSSRRPWLFRKEYETIDRILSQNPATHFQERRHPEEFAGAFLLKRMRGSWSVPRRNTVFTGRDAEIGQVHARLVAQHNDRGVARVNVAGMAGVGKTQLCTEYCYRYFPSYYGLVIWLSAQSAESIAAGFRQLMADTTDIDLVKEKDTDEVVADIKARLFRSKVQWLLVFDNLEDHGLLDKFVPNGGPGHVLVTTRIVHTSNHVDSFADTMVLRCFHPTESVQLLCRAAGNENICKDVHKEAAKKLSESLGHLPLALGMAAAYMRKCDVDCSEYLARYLKSETRGSLLGHEAVSSSLALSLNAIRRENPVAWEALRLLGWLGPDQITKKLLRSLLAERNKKEKEAARKAKRATEQALRKRANSMLLLSSIGGITLFSILAIGLHRRKSFGRPQWSVLVGLSSLFSAVVCASIPHVCRHDESWTNTSASSPATAPTSLTRNMSVDIFDQTDQIWKILKSFSLLVVKEGKGSMHRLLAQALRASQSPSDSKYNLDICLRAILQSWTFKPDQVDTWQASTNMLGHVKSVILHSTEIHGVKQLETAILSREAGVLIAMALNNFEEAQFSLELSVRMLDGVDNENQQVVQARAASLQELGRVFRYEGLFKKSQEALMSALQIRSTLAKKYLDARQGVAATLHELGVLEVKKHSLESAEKFLQQALDIRRKLDLEADCASTLHQLAAVQVARKPPSLDRAESLLKEALGLDMQIGQRAATLKQLARVAIRRGEFDVAETSLGQALELYFELYGENALHVNIAAVKYQQGALAFQRDQLEQAWLYFSECLCARRHVYAYSQGNHLEVSTVLHELGRVAFAETRTHKATETFMEERAILDRLWETSSQRRRLLQTRLMNLTWLRKCAKASGSDTEARKLLAEQGRMKQEAKMNSRRSLGSIHPQTLSLQQEALACRILARQYVLCKPGESNAEARAQLESALKSLKDQMEQAPKGDLRVAAERFHAQVSDSFGNPNQQRSIIFDACDGLRDVLRDQGLEVNDRTQRRKK